MSQVKSHSPSPLIQRVKAAQNKNSLTLQIVESTIMFSIGVGVGIIFCTVILLKFGC